MARFTVALLVLLGLACVHAQTATQSEQQPVQVRGARVCGASQWCYDAGSTRSDQLALACCCAVRAKQWPGTAPPTPHFKASKPPERPHLLKGSSWQLYQCSLHPVTWRR